MSTQRGIANEISTSSQTKLRARPREPQGTAGSEFSAFRCHFATNLLVSTNTMLQSILCTTSDVNQCDKLAANAKADGIDSATKVTPQTRQGWQGSQKTAKHILHTYPIDIGRLWQKQVAWWSARANFGIGTSWRMVLSTRKTDNSTCWRSSLLRTLQWKPDVKSAADWSRGEEEERDRKHESIVISCLWHAKMALIVGNTCDLLSGVREKTIIRDGKSVDARRSDGKSKSFSASLCAFKS